MENDLEFTGQVADEAWLQVACARCGLMKPRSEFAIDRKSRAGRRSWCKECVNEQGRPYERLRKKYAPATEGVQPCGECGEVKHATEFDAGSHNPPRPPYLSGRYHTCKACRRRRRILYRYGEAALAAWDAHEGGCENCGTTEWGGRGGIPSIDHSHATGEFRGILCHGCNACLGYAHDDPVVLRSLADYVESRS